MKILVTGGAGFIGSHVTDELIRQNYEVIVLDDLSGGYRQNISPKVKFIKGSIENTDLLDKLFNKHRFDCVYHLAAYAAEGLSHFIRKFNYENNLIGSINLINRSVLYKVKHFVFTSSIAVYGTNQLPMTEKTVPEPEDPYGIAKYAIELDLKAANRMFGLKYTIFRPHNVYGERQNIADPYRNVIGIFINNILHDKPMTIFGNGKQTRAFSYIADIAPYIANCIKIKDAENEIFNIGADKPYAVLDLAHTVAHLMGVQPNIVHLPPRKEVLHAFSDHSKVKKIFKISKAMSLEDGLVSMIAWAKQVEPLNPTIFNNIEIEDKMPPSWKTLIKA